mmetsp:Transcript_27255/g.40362  ORF Transcript_27255/g.40362 Transcript_27255/m.40362 type:complete len:325 (-) Transcript_27255:76-1050(-)
MVTSEVIELLSSDEEEGSSRTPPTTSTTTSADVSSSSIIQRPEEIIAQQSNTSGNISAKRAREDETTTRDGETVNSLLQQLLKVDADQLAMLERHDSDLIAQLESFSDNLRASIVRVKNARLDEEKALQQARDLACKVQHEKERSEMVASKLCFDCKKPSDTLEPCTGFDGFETDGVGGEGILACEGCRDNKVICPECNHFLCEQKSCCDASYRCTGCEEIICLGCAEKNNYAGKHCSCEEFYCAECADDNILEEQCCSCATKHTTCGSNNCSCRSGFFKKCEGDCEQPLCDECVQKLACGNEVHFCGDCEYDCVDCDWCAGYY